MTDLEKIQEVFPGAELNVPVNLTDRICILNDVRVHCTFEQVAYVHKVDSEGIETDVDNPLDTWPELQRDYRTYFCENCGYQAPGEEEFETMRQHLGKRNVFLHPFGSTL